MKPLRAAEAERPTPSCSLLLHEPHQALTRKMGRAPSTEKGNSHHMHRHTHTALHTLTPTHTPTHTYTCSCLHTHLHTHTLLLLFPPKQTIIFRAEKQQKRGLEETGNPFSLWEGDRERKSPSFFGGCSIALQKHV